MVDALSSRLSLPSSRSWSPQKEQVRIELVSTESEDIGAICVIGGFMDLVMNTMTQFPPGAVSGSGQRH